MELKKDIDLVGKDVLKLILLGDRGYKRTQIVWEDVDDSHTQYPKILNHAVSEGWLDAWFYFTPKSFDKELKQFKEFLKKLARER